MNGSALYIQRENGNEAYQITLDNRIFDITSKCVMI